MQAASRPRIAIADAGRDEFDDLVVLLVEHGVDDDTHRDMLARLIAAACLGANHLWQDLNLPDRESLSRLLREHFPLLYAKNVGNMRWKKFFYRQLCERAGLRSCNRPSCGDCCDYAECFGPEDAPGADSARP